MRQFHKQTHLQNLKQVFFLQFITNLKLQSSVIDTFYLVYNRSDIVNVNPAVLILFHNESCIKMLFVEQLSAFEYFHVYYWKSHICIFFVKR